MSFEANKSGYKPVRHVPEEFLAKARLKPGFSDAYAALEFKYALVRQMLKARWFAGCVNGISSTKTY
jgi:hypothetical protein